jgi:hypothetical protein
MARIRSVHPGLFTDEAFVGLSSDAQIFLIGLWTEADDQGVFEWKPVSLRMRLRPTKDGAVDGLLREMEAANIIRSFEIDGRRYGAVRNFRKYQRPKSPNAIHHITDDIRTYVGLAQSISEIDDAKPPETSEIPPQMEDGGGRREKEKKDSAGAGSSKYAFESGIIKLNQKDFDLWKASYSHLDLAAELVAMTPWAAQQGKKWFHAVPNALAKRNREVKARKDQLTEQGGFQWNGGIEGVI